MSRRVVVTGIGPVTSVGTGKEDYWQGLLAGRSGISRVEAFDTSEFATQIGAEIRGFDAKEYMSGKEARRMDRFCHFAIAGTKIALDDARLKIDDANAGSVGVMIGSGIGGIATLEEQANILRERGPGRVSPFLVPMMISNMAAGYVSIMFGAKGPNLCTVTACASSAHAIGEAYETIKRGHADVMIAGGCEAAITPLGYAGFCALKAMSTRNDAPEKASRPFDVDRDGFVMGEGAGILIMEAVEHAQSREADIYAEFAGYGATADAFHITAPSPDGEGAARAMRIAMEENGLKPRDIDYINAHGTSTKYNDEYETMAIRKVFGADADRIAVSSTKSMTGHLLGAAGGIEAIILALALSEDQVPPTINLDEPDPLCDLDYVANKSRTLRCRAAISNSLGFGGHNAALAMKKWTA